MNALLDIIFERVTLFVETIGLVTAIASFNLLNNAFLLLQNLVLLGTWKIFQLKWLLGDESNGQMEEVVPHLGTEQFA